MLKAPCQNFSQLQYSRLHSKVHESNPQAQHRSWSGGYHCICMNTSVNRCGKTVATITFPPNASLTSGFELRENSQQATALKRSKRQTHPQCCHPGCRCLWVCGRPAGPVAEPVPDWSGGPGTPELSDLEERTPQRNVRENGASLKTQVVTHDVWLCLDQLLSVSDQQGTLYAPLFLFFTF